jgi:glycosyltransferase involved in cell wall biosynthesis
MSAPDISIIVCTQNRAAMLRGALASLYDLATDGFTYEIVVIDNGSTDDTQKTIATAATQSRKALRGIYEPEKGIVPARNRGIREARGRWIAFFDDDQLADSRWLAELHRGAVMKQCRVVGGSVQLTFPGGCTRRLDPTVRMLLGEAMHGDQPLPYGGRLTPGCGNLMIDRTVFVEVGAFQRTVSGRGEDTDLFSRIERAGIAGWYLPLAIVHHLTPQERLKTEYLLSLAYRMGEGIALRQAGHLSRSTFAALWMAKAARLALAQAPWAAVWRCCGHHEAWLGRRCQVAINASFLRAGRKLIFARRNKQAFKKPGEVHCAPLMHPTESAST